MFKTCYQHRYLIIIVSIQFHAMYTIIFQQNIMNLEELVEFI